MARFKSWQHTNIKRLCKRMLCISNRQAWNKVRCYMVLQDLPIYTLLFYSEVFLLCFIAVSVSFLLTPKDLYDHQGVTIHSSLSIWQGTSLQDSKDFSLITRSAQLRTYQALMSVLSSLQALANVNPFISDLQPDKFQIVISTIGDIFCTIPLWQFLGH